MRIRSCLAAVLLAGVVPATAAYGQRVSPGDVQRGVTVETRPRPDFDPLGVRLGAFRIDGFAEAGLGYDSNVFGRKRNVKDDIYATETANISLSSEWSRHAVGASATIDSRQFVRQSDLSWTDWNIGGFGRYDIDAQTNVEARYRHYREHLDVFNVDVQRAGILQPVPFDSDEFQVSGTTSFNRLGLSAIGLYRTYSFEDTDTPGQPVPAGQQTSNGQPISGGQRNFNSLNNFDTMIGAAAASYAFSPGRFINAIVRLQDISYDRGVSRGRDSFTVVALTGFEYDFDGVWAGRIAVGYQQREYNDPRTPNLQGPAFEGRLSWSPTQLTTVTFNVARSIEESIRVSAGQTAVGYQRTTAGARVDHEFLRNVILGAELRADRREYEQPNEKATDAVLQLSGRWLINRSVALTGTYAYNRRIEATGPVEVFDRNLFQVRLRIAL